MTAVFNPQQDGSYKFTDMETARPQLLPEMREAFHDHGFLIVRNLFNKLEREKLHRTFVETPGEFQNATFIVNDFAKTTYNQNQWIEPGTDMVGRLSGNAKVAGLAKQFLNAGDLYMANGKFVRKQGNSGGEVMWHQDFGHWFERYDFVTVIIALTKSDQENGGIQIIERGHTYGRPEHKDNEAGQSTLQQSVIDKMIEENHLIHVNLAAGDVVFFHGNMPHKSDGNFSEHARANIIFNFVAKSNGIVPELTNHINIRGEYPVFNALNGDYELYEFDANAIKNCDNYEMQKRRFLDVNKNKKAAKQ